MIAIIFDLDDTIFNTKECKPYLRTQIGRDVICNKIEDGIIEVQEQHNGIVSFINELIKDNIHVFIFSDSPKNYCVTLINKFGINVHESCIYGSQHKPCVDYHELFDDYDRIAVVGDSAKDIYFAHMYGFTSILLGRLSKNVEKFYQDWSKPTSICTSLKELSDELFRFSEGELNFIEHDFSSKYKKFDHSTVKLIKIPHDRIGYSYEYWSNPNEWNNIEERKNIWFDVQRSIKVAKELNNSQIAQKVAVSFYNRSGFISDGKPFRNIMWIYYANFVKWANSLGLSGNVYLVPVPPSAPIECNESFSMNELVKMWATYAYHSKRNNEINFDLVPAYIVDRFWPTPSSHLTGGMREIEPHLKTMGVFEDVDKIGDASTVIIIDDIVTSGTQMNAVATVLTASGVFPISTIIYGYALAKTTHTDEQEDDDWF
ncbi:hypothetical protein [Pectobacterium brasiliense]|uniref:hypothetical protein n=1 Tax=Pectobacterium brasiliense TaxID=180957 RepID=UPI0005833F44|nr:hypothetical protein [Pectobacterium brasiliense]KHT17902.1 hypothetical protein RC95_13480 [Pectobacterium brasiliense]GKW26733.1 hypothetical protein PEC311524_43270 [Pectobacterium carotovorum subsp. carotovorum]